MIDNRQVETEIVNKKEEGCGGRCRCYGSRADHLTERCVDRIGLNLGSKSKAGG
jgi:hypothetical protein